MKTPFDAKRHGILGAMAVAAALFPSISFADCSRLDEDDNWNTGLTKLIEQVNTSQYKEAVETAKPMYGICESSPALFYYTALALRGSGDEERARIYFTKASELTSVMAVESGLSRKIWFERYEADHPESTADAITKRKEEIENLRKELDVQLELNHKQEVELATRTGEIEAVNSKNLDAVKQYKAIMWTGVGVGMAGVVAAGVGGGLVAINDGDKKIKPSEPKLGDPVDFTDTYKASWACLGIGIGLAVSGAIMAGIGGYLYSNAGSKDGERVGDEIAINIGPGSAILDIRF